MFSTLEMGKGVKLEGLYWCCLKAHILLTIAVVEAMSIHMTVFLKIDYV